MTLVSHGLHPKIKFLDTLGTVTKLVGQCFCALRRKIVLIVELVLKACPEIHRDRSELYFDLHVALLVLKEDRHLDDQVKASISARLRILDIVLSCDQGDVVLCEKSTCDLIDIIREGADHAHAGYVVDVFFDGGEIEGYVLLSHLTEQAVDGLHSRLDALDRVSLELYREGLVEDPEFRFDLHEGRRF